MQAYLITTGSLFGVLTVAHVWRIIEEGPQLARNAWWALITIAAAALSVWAWRLLRRAAVVSQRAQDGPLEPPADERQESP